MQWIETHDGHYVNAAYIVSMRYTERGCTDIELEGGGQVSSDTQPHRIIEELSRNSDVVISCNEVEVWRESDRLWRDAREAERLTA